MNHLAAIAVEDRLAQEALSGALITTLIRGQDTIAITAGGLGGILGILAIENLIPNEAGILGQIELNGIEEGIEIIDHHDRALGTAAHRRAVEILLAVTDAELVFHRGALEHRQQVVVLDFANSLVFAECGHRRIDLECGIGRQAQDQRIGQRGDAGGGKRETRTGCRPGGGSIRLLLIEGAGIRGEQGRFVAGLGVLRFGENPLHRQ